MKNILNQFGFYSVCMLENLSKRFLLVCFCTSQFVIFSQKFLGSQIKNSRDPQIFVCPHLQLATQRLSFAEFEVATKCECSRLKKLHSLDWKIQQDCRTCEVIEYRNCQNFLRKRVLFANSIQFFSNKTRLTSLLTHLHCSKMIIDPRFAWWKAMQQNIRAKLVIFSDFLIQNYLDHVFWQLIERNAWKRKNQGIFLWMCKGQVLMQAQIFCA